MDLFDKIGKKASEAYKITADKTGKLAKETKLRMRISELRSQITDIYEEIGKKVYEKHVTKEELNSLKELEDECTRIDVLGDEIELKLKECLELKDRKQCQSCFKEIEKEAKFCPECGVTQEEPVKEVEVLEKIDKVENKSGEYVNVEEIEIDDVIEVKPKEEKSDLERTVEIESNVEKRHE